MEKPLKITKLADCVGCGSKVSAKALGRLLNGLPPNSDQQLIIGYEKNDDACVYALLGLSVAGR